MTKKQEPAHRVLIEDDLRVEIWHLSDFQFDHLCIFSVTGKGIVRVYMSHVSDDTAHLPQSELLHWLLDHVNTSHVKLLKKFTAEALASR